MNRAQKFLTLAAIAAVLCILFDYNSRQIDRFFGLVRINDTSIETTNRCAIEAITVTVVYVGLFVILRKYKFGRK